MVKIFNEGMEYRNGSFYPSDKKNNFRKTISFQILEKHNTAGEIKNKNQLLNLKFDAITSHDITYVGIIQTARAIGLEKFPIPYILTNCHNSLCAVGGTINEDDHVFGLTAAKRYGGIYVPAHVAVIHSYIREMVAGCGKMILGSDSHTRYGALGTLGVGEGGPELVKQIISKTYDINMPEVIAIQLKNKPRKGVGPHDVAIALISTVFKKGILKNKILEFVGDGVENLSLEYRNGIDVMTTETTCLSSIWQTDEKVENYLAKHNRARDYKQLMPIEGAYYDGLVEIDLAKIEPMIALPFHPSNGVKISDLLKNPKEILGGVEREGKRIFGDKFSLLNKIDEKGIKVDQAIIAGCSGGIYDNVFEAGEILEQASADTLAFSVYPGSLPVYFDLMKKGSLGKIVRAGGIVKTCFCGPCFGAGDVPANNGLSIRHTTRNFESREGSKPNDGQSAAVALMDARSIAATVANGGYITSALNFDYDANVPEYDYDEKIYENKVYEGFGLADKSVDLILGPNIVNWPENKKLANTLIIKLASVLLDPVTTTDELIPSGEISSYRSNPLKLAEFTLSRKDPEYVSRAKEIKMSEKNIVTHVESILNVKFDDVDVVSGIYAISPGDGSAREQAASSQRVLGGGANIAKNYATKRYRSNLINWGIIPFVSEENFELGDIIVIENTSAAIDENKTVGKRIRNNIVDLVNLQIEPLTDVEKEIIKQGNLINYQKNEKEAKR